MLEQPVEVGQVKRISMPEASEKCVHILLRYLYTGYLCLGEQEGPILVELWKVAHEFKIIELEREMKNILVEKPVSGFSVRLAVDMFRFARNLVNDDVARLLKDKAVLALKRFNKNMLGLITN